MESTKEEIGRAARKLSLLYHPDKTDDPTEREKFILINKAKEILLDDPKRKEIDDFIRAKAKRKEYDDQRFKFQSSKKSHEQSKAKSKSKEMPMEMEEPRTQKCLHIQGTCGPPCPFGIAKGSSACHG